MKRTHRVATFAVATTLTMAGMAMPAFAGDDGGGKGNGGDTSSSVAPKPSLPETPRSTTPRTTEPKKTTSTTEQESEGTETSRPSTPTTAKRRDEKTKDKVRESQAVLDALVKKLEGSTVDAGVKADLIARLTALKASLLSGAPIDPALIKTLAGEIRVALGEAEHKEESTTSSIPENEDGAAKKERGRVAHTHATEALQAQIDKVNASNLPDDIKAKVIAALTAAQQEVDKHANAPDAAKEIKDTLEAHRAAKFAKMYQRLTSVGDRVQAAIDAAAATPGFDAAAASAQLTDARAKLEAATTVADLKTVWQLMRDIRRSLPHTEEAATTTAVTTTTTTTTSTPEVTTIAP